MPRPLVPLLATLLTLVVAAPASAAVDWPAFDTLSEAGHVASGGVLEVNQQGRAVAAWTDSPDPDRTTETSAWVAARDGERWVGQRISAPGIAEAVLDSRDVQLDVDVDPQGTGIVVWGDDDGVLASVRAPGGAWSAPITVAAGGRDPAVVIDSAGRATVVYLQPQPGPSGSRIAEVDARQRAGDGTWGTVQRLSKATEEYRAPDVAADIAGDLAVVWASTSANGTWVNERTAGGSWKDPDTPTDLAAGTYTGGWDPTVAKPPLEDATVVGDCEPLSSPTGCVGTVHVRPLQPRQGEDTPTWDRQQLFGTANRSPQVAGSGAGEPGAAGTFVATLTRTVAVGDLTGSWFSVGPTGTQGGAGRLATNDDGRALMVTGSAQGPIESIDRYPGGTWSAPQAVPGADGAFVEDAGLDRAGRPTVLLAVGAEDGQSGTLMRASRGPADGTQPPAGDPPSAPPAPPAGPGAGTPAGPAGSTPAGGTGAAVGGKRTQPLGATVGVGVSCPSAACTVTGSGSVSVPGGAARVFKLKPAKAVRLKAGGRTTLRLRVPAKARAAARRALKRKRRVVARVRVLVRPAAGGAAKVLDRRVRLRARHSRE